MRKFVVAVAVVLTALVAANASARAAQPAPITIVVFNPPSLGAVFPDVIKQQKFDVQNGIDITFVERPPDAYAAQFNSGEFQVGGSASVLILGLGATRGIKTTYLFNLFDYWGTVVTSRPEIKTLADLKGKQLAAAKGTTNYTMFAWLAKQQGIDPDSFQVVNTATPGLVGYAIAERADAVQLWEPAYSLVKAAMPQIHTIDLNIAKVWNAFSGGGTLPYLGVAAHQEWIDQHRDLVAPLYRAYKQAADWVMANPAAAAPLIASLKTDAERDAITTLIKENKRLALNLQPAGKIAKQIEATYKAGIDVGLFKAMPPASSIYSGEMN
ncbi:MAG TPA: ABC transporter substrate-binding protein [Xanthobacteraceae bacterium]|jgi:NitT/TauT family transport system substrate-binding protein|nr:ABC transporter substrate-binding protein [Xanthobacteraceae bacterium]